MVYEETAAYDLDMSKYKIFSNYLQLKQNKKCD